ncbi:MAG: protein kinase [Candidatus Zixiibacteriota bacterium]|nr:MAG: protein kinase [candidate division Zixibacteria bacterium]
MTSEEPDNDRTVSGVILPKGTAVAQYRIIERIGFGGMGEVYLAEDAALKRNVALKFLLPVYASREDFRRRFTREAQAAAALSHPNIITIHEVSEYMGRPFFAMELVEGRSLRSIIQDKPPAMSRVLDIAIQVCEGLREAHDSGIIHRDVKPANILTDKRGEVKILDFGLARIEGVSGLTRPNTALGTVGYMSPEQVSGEPADSRSDIFSLGIVLYEMVTGRHPFMKDSAPATLNAILQDTPEPVARYKADVPDDLQKIIDKALEKSHEMRYHHIDDILTDLKRLRRDVASGSSVLSTEVLTAAARRRAYLPVMAPLAIVALAVLLVLIIPSSRQSLFRMFGAETVPSRKHLAILPFANVGEVTANQAFCDGLLETLTSKVTQLEQFQDSFWVIPASEVRELNVGSARQARKAFGITLAITGSVQHMREKLRMTMNLVDAKDGRQLRSMVIDAYPADVSALQDSIVIELARMLEVQLRPEGRRLVEAGGTEVPRAYELYLNGRGYLKEFREAGNLNTAIELFRSSLGSDSSFALAYAGLGEAYWCKYRITKESDWVEQATAMCRRAMELDDQVVPGYVTLGMIYRGTGRHEEAVAEFKRALALDSFNNDAYRGLARAYEEMNKAELAEATYRKVIELKPDYWGGYFDLSMFYIYQGRQEEALELLDKVVEYGPVRYVGWNDLGALYFQFGQWDEAREMWDRSLEIEPNYGAYSNLGSLHYVRQQYADAAAMYEKALKLDDHDYNVWMNLASAYYWMPEKRTKAPEIYNRAIELAEKVREINPRDVDALANLGECYAMTARREKALLMTEQALSLMPDNVYIMAQAGIVYEVLGERDSAIELFGRALKYGYPRSYIEHSPALKDLLADPRFQDMIQGNGDAGKDTITSDR